MKHFTELSLDPLVLEALEKMGYKTMTPIQEQAIPKLLAGYDFLGQAPTGTGKTAAFGIPLISRLSVDEDFVQVLILAPTRELAQQIAEELNRIGEVKGIRTLAIYGGESIFVQKEELRKRNTQIVVGTPGRVLDHLRQVSLDLTKTRLAVLDEADEMLDMGFLPDLEAILKHLPGGRETWLFSATMSKEIRQIADRYMYHPEEIRIQPQSTSAENIRQYYYVVDEEDKPRLIRNLLKHTEDIYGIIFCRTKRDVVQLARKLRDQFPLDCLHGAMAQSDRDQVMNEFREGKLRILVSTDITARGIDVSNLTHIINYSPPDDPESYIHRIGRTARKGESGTAITLFTPDEKSQLEQLERRVKMPLEKHEDSTMEFDPNARPGRGGRRRYGPSSSSRSGVGGGQRSQGGGQKKRRRGPRRSSGSSPSGSA